MDAASTPRIGVLSAAIRNGVSFVIGASWPNVVTPVAKIRVSPL